MKKNSQSPQEKKNRENLNSSNTYGFRASNLEVSVERDFSVRN